MANRNAIYYSRASSPETVARTYFLQKMVGEEIT